MSRAKHRIELLKRDRGKGVVKLKLDEEEVTVEKFTQEERKEQVERKKKENLAFLFISVGYINFGDIIWKGKDDYICIPTKPEIYYQRKAMAIYRLMWYFGIPLEAGTTDEYSCIYGFKYKGYVFELMDEPGSLMRIDSRHLIPSEEYDLSSETDKKYMPPKKICEEIVSIMEHLMKNPVEIFTSGGPELV